MPKSFKLCVFAMILMLTFGLAATGCSSDDNTESQMDGDTDTVDRDADAADGDAESVDGDADTTDGDAESVDGDTEAADGDAESVTTDWRLPYAAPDGRGPYNVGARPVVFEDTENERHLTGMLWYPTDAVEGEELYYQSILKAEGVFKNAPLAEEGNFPIVIFSHGNSGFAEQSFYLTEFFASHGFVVASCDHIGNTSGTHDSSLMGWMSQRRPQDMSIMIDYLENWQQDNTHFLAGRLDLDHIAAIGHSFGGFTVLYLAGAEAHIEEAIEICENQTPGEELAFCKLVGAERLKDADPDLVVADSRVKTAVSLAPAGYVYFSEAGLKKLNVPVQIQVGDKDQTLNYEAESVNIYNAMNPVKELVLFKDAGHFTFSNMCTLIAQFGDGCGEGYMNIERAWDYSNLFALAFIRSFIFNDERDRQYLSDDYTGTLDDIELRATHE